MPVKIRLVKTCGACPEQYEAFLGDEQVGYLRLRHGHFSVDCPDVGGKTVYSAYPDGDGTFRGHERTKYLNAACRAILEHLGQGQEDQSPIYDLQDE
jgi:hypothetical protein